MNPIAKTIEILNDDQKRAIQCIKEGHNILITGSGGTGKCLGKGTPVMLFNGSIKNVENIVVGDLLMGDDNESRKVLSTTMGYDIMYMITHTNGDNYVVNSEHILSLKYGIKNHIYDSINKYAYCVVYFDSGTTKSYTKLFSYKNDDKCKVYAIAKSYFDNLNSEYYVDISIKKYLQLAPNIKNHLYGYYACLSKQRIDSSKITVTKLQHGEYYGFEIDNNGRFVLGNFIVTHNSFLIPRIKTLFKEQKNRYLITAMTGAAASIISGITFHMALGLGIPKPIEHPNDDGGGGISKAEALAEGIFIHLLANKKDFIWKTLDAIVVDEVSMLAPDLFEAVDIVAKRLRDNKKPFGGIQFVFMGDFFQLPPVHKNWLYDGYAYKYAFENPIWKKNVTKIIELTHIYRQGSDITFAACLNRIRIGKQTSEDIQLIQSCMNKSPTDAQIKPTRLYSTNKAVDKLNNEELLRLNQPIYIYNTNVNIYNKTTLQEEKEDILQPLNISKTRLEILRTKYGSDEKIRLALGAQVMLRVNLDVAHGLVNGSRGVIVGFDKYPIVRFLNGEQIRIEPYVWESEENKLIVLKKQVPLRLAYALTIHCCQGATLDYVEVEIGSAIFEYGQTYTALSRVKNTEGLFVLSFNPNKIKVDKRVLKYFGY